MSPQAIFNAIPDWLKKFIGYGVSAGIAFACVVFAFLSFGPLSAYIKEKLGITRDIESVSGSIQYATEDQMNAAIDLSVHRMVSDSRERIQHENDSLFQAVSNGLIEPGIKRLRSVEENIKRLNGLMGLSNDLITRQLDESKATNDHIDRLQRELDGQDIAAKLDNIIREMREQRDDIEEIKKARNTKQKF